MTLKEYDLKNEYEDSYNEATQLWNSAYSEMNIDLQFYLGNQWSEAEKTYLRGEGRNTYVYNYCQRNVHLNSGHQRKNRLGFGVDPQEVGDEKYSDICEDGLIWQANKSDFYHKLSNCFQDASITGLSMMTFGLDYSKDIVNGDLYCKNESFQSMLIDPLFSQIDGSDCRFMMKRTYLGRSMASELLPSAKKDITKVKSGRIDNKFPYMSFSANRTEENDILAYDEFYKRISRPYKEIIHRYSGERLRWRGDKKSLAEFLARYPYFDVTTNYEPGIDYTVFVQGEPMFNGTDPLKIDDYPSTPILWVYQPQYEDFAYKIQGMIRPIRDTQSEYNRKRSKISDMIDSQATGWVVEKGAVVNQEDLFKSGQGQVIETKVGKLGAIREKASVEIPSGLLNLVQLLTTDMIQIPGFNEESLGVAEGGNTEVSGTLAKQRAMNAITVFQGVYDNLNISQKECGIKMLKIMLANYTPEKWEKITQKQFPPDMDIKKVMQFDLLVKETQLTDSQKNLSYFQALEAKKLGLNVPEQYLIEEMPVSNSGRMKELYEQQQQQMQQQQAEQKEIAMAQVQSQMKLEDSLSTERNTRAYSNIGLAQERKLEAIKDLEQATLDKIKSIKELQGIDLNQLQQALEIIEKMNQGEVVKTQVLTGDTGDQVQKAQQHQPQPQPQSQQPTGL